MKTKKNNININEDDLYKIGYEFHNFYNTFNESLNYNYREQMKEEEEIIDFPSFCFAKFTNSILNYQTKIK